jgi:hypothetical protein
MSTVTGIDSWLYNGVLRARVHVLFITPLLRKEVKPVHPRDRPCRAGRRVEAGGAWFRAACSDLTFLPALQPLWRDCTTPPNRLRLF